MRFAGENLNPEYLSPGTFSDNALYKENTSGPEKTSIDPGSLKKTPEMTPNRDFDSPFHEEYLRDKYIRHDPGSGITQMTAPQQIRPLG